MASATRYLSLAEFKSRLHPNDLAGTTKGMTDEQIDARLTACLGFGADEIDGYASPRYTTPLVVNESIRTYTFRLARWELLRRANWNYTEGEAKQEVALRDQLGQIAQHKFALVDQAARGSVEQNTSIRPNDPPAEVSGRTSVFNPDSMKDY